MSFKTTLGNLLNLRNTIVTLNECEVEIINWIRDEEGKPLYLLEVCDDTQWYFLDQDVLVTSTGGVSLNEYPVVENDFTTCMACLNFKLPKPVTQSDLEK